MAVVGAPRRVKALLSSFMHTDKHSSENSPREGEDEHSANKRLDHHSEARDKQAFWARVESFSKPFTWFAKPLELSPPCCAKYGWENTDVDILCCVSCKMCVDATLATTWDASMYTKTCSKLQDALTTGHSKICRWPDNPSPDSFLVLPVLSSSKWKEDFQRRCVSLVALGENLPFLDEEDIKEMVELREEYIQLLQRTQLAGDTQWDTKTDDEDEVLRVACLVALCGWERRLSEDDENSHILFCTACRREIGLWNFHRLKGIDEVSCQLPLKDVNPSVDESLECETMSVSEEQSTVQGTVQTRDISDVEKLQYTGMGATDSGVCDTENETTSRGTTAENVLTEEEKMDEDVSAITAGCERRESTMDTSECVSDTSERIVGGEKCAETVDTGDEPPRNTPSADSTCSATVSVEDGSSTTHDKKRTHSPMLVVDSEDKSVAGATSEQTEKHDNSKYKFEREHPFMTPTHPSATAHVAHMPHLVEGSEYGESLCVEVGEESLDDRLRALDTELELISQGAGDVTSEQDDEGPNKKRPRLEDLEKSVFNILGEHRNWCPWVVAMEMQSHNESLPGWKMLLYELLPANGPAARQTLLDAAPSEAWKSVRKMLNDCYVAPVRVSGSGDTLQ